MLETVVQQILNGLTLGGIYALIALGYTMVYGIVKLINFAHGEIFMVGAFIGLMVINHISDNVIVVLVLAMVGCAGLGFLVEKAAYRPLRQSTKMNMLFTATAVVALLTFAFSLKNPIGAIVSSKIFWIGLIVYGVLVLWIFKGKHKSLRGGSSRINALISAIGMSIIISNMVALINGPQRATYPNIINLGKINIGSISISGLQIFILVSSFALMYGLYHIVHKTKTGVAMRAVSQNLEAAKLMGINPNKVIGYTFGLGSALAAAAGVLVGVFYSVADPMMGSMYGLKAFVAAVLGGIGSIPGAMVGGLILGIAETTALATGVFSSFKDAIAFGILIIILIIKPTGIFGSSTREKV